MVEVRKQLEAQEAIIKQHRKGLSESVAAFRRIRDEKLYRAKCKTIEEYITRFDGKLGLKRLYQLDAFERHDSEFEKVTNVPPPNERVLRELNALGSKIGDDVDRHKLFHKIAEIAKSKKLTTTAVRNVASAHAEELNISGFGDDYPTPDWLFRPLYRIFHFEVDVAANKHNHKCEQYFTVQQDGLKQDWTKFKSVWCNPPFSSMGDWVKKGHAAALRGTSVAIVTMHNTETPWFQEYCWCADLMLVNGRVQFDNASEANRYGTIVLLFRLPKLTDDQECELMRLSSPKNSTYFQGAMLYHAPVPMAEAAWDAGELIIPGCNTQKQFMAHFGYKHVELDGTIHWL